MKMKNKLNILCVFLSFFIFSFAALAHPPKDIKLQWDPLQKILSVHIEHAVDNPEKHHIKSIKVEVNGKIFEERMYKTQENSKIQIDTFKIPDISSGANITVTAECNIFGTMKKEIVIP